MEETPSPTWTHLNGPAGWPGAILAGFLASLVILGLYVYWFAVANRYVIFLHGHMGAGPFVAITRSRYWMAGLVADGVLLVLYTAANWLLGQIATGYGRPYRPPPWPRVWFVCALLLLPGILLITMTQNWPTLPLDLALLSAIATLAGLALALPAGDLAACQPAELIWRVLHGAGLVPVLLLVRALELPSRGLVDTGRASAMAFFGLTGGIAWLLANTWLRAARRRPALKAAQILATGLCLSYLVLPLLHYLLLVPPDYRYITTAANFFAYGWLTQLLTLLLALALAIGFAWLGRRWDNRVATR